MGDKRPPRLFSRPQDARVALGHWLDGKKSHVHYQDMNGNYDWRDECQKVPGRKACDMEIVRVEIKEK